MPSIYLSPSVQEFNPYINGGNEEYYMNLIADAMVPYLRASGIDFTRNNPNDTLAELIEHSNEGEYDLHLALHSNAAPATMPGALQGPDVYYYAYSEEGRKAADLIANNLKAIYPNPSLVTVIGNTTLPEIRRTKAPAVLVETAYHDNYEDAEWIKNNIDEIGRNLTLSVTEYLEVPFVDPNASYDDAFPSSGSLGGVSVSANDGPPDSKPASADRTSGSSAAGTENSTVSGICDVCHTTLL